MILWPRIAELDRKTLSDVALELAFSRLHPLVRESGANNRGPEVDLYQRAVGLAPPDDPHAAGWPWCTCGAFCVWREAARQKALVNPFPKTAKAVNVWTLSEPICRTPNPRHGSFFVLDHGTKWIEELRSGVRLTDNGHVGWDVFVDEAVLEQLRTMGVDVAGLGVGAWHTLSANTNGAGSREGNQWGLHPVPDGGGPETVHGGVLLGRLDFDLAAQAPA